MIGEDGLELLTEAECLRLLGGASIGRVAVSIGALPAVFPVNFALVDGAIIFKTGEGTKLAAALAHAVVAFEVDAIDAMYHEGWSVMVVGPAEEVTDTIELQRLRNAPVTPWAGGHRDHIIRIRPEFTSGRRITHGVH